MNKKVREWLGESFYLGDGVKIAADPSHHGHALREEMMFRLYYLSFFFL